MKNELNRAFMTKKKIYSTPLTDSILCTMQQTLCGSGTIQSNINLQGGDKSGDVSSAF